MDDDVIDRIAVQKGNNDVRWFHEIIKFNKKSVVFKDIHGKMTRIPYSKMKRFEGKDFIWCRADGL